jgi:hypothetical protein
MLYFSFFKRGYMKPGNIKGQGAVKNIHNHFEKNRYEKSIYDDDFEEQVAKTEILEIFPKTIVNPVKSPDLSMAYSMNPYQGCEHGCAYCFARPTHEYWGYSAGVDFERKILVKRNAPELLEQFFKKRGYKPETHTYVGQYRLLPAGRAQTSNNKKAAAGLPGL